jgi:hypothetical protein
MTILEAFLSQTCPACQGVKEKHTAFCVSCYRRLPLTLRGALWKRFGSGYEEAQRAGLAFLTQGQRSLFSAERKAGQ